MNIRNRLRQLIFESEGDFGYHAGNLKQKAEKLSDRGFIIGKTGQMGTGHYFYGNLEKAKKHAAKFGGKINDNSVYAVDFSKYTLFKPSNPREYYDNLVVVINNDFLKHITIEDFNNPKIIETIKDAADFYRHCGVNISDEDFMSIAKEFVNDLQTKSSQSDDMFNTRVLKAAGFEGVDVRNTPLDNFAVGSIIFDIKPNTVKKIQR
jgi:hypothetical protein